MICSSRAEPSSTVSAPRASRATWRLPGRIAQIGKVSESDAKRVFDARDLIVAPGFIDLHTHFDSQIFWDPYCTMSGWHGVTSVVIGNCGFGFAPVKPEDRERSMRADLTLFTTATSMGSHVKTFRQREPEERNGETPSGEDSSKRPILQ